MPQPREGALEEINVLTVDDEPAQLELLTMYLEEYDPGIHVEPVTSPAETLRRLKDNAYDCIIADHKMPGMTGVELAQRVKENQQIPIILYTGQGSEEVASDALHAGVDDYLRKEPDPEHYRVLASRIREAVKRYRTRSGKRPRSVALPEYPKVEMRGNQVVIVWEDGREESWGSEDADRIDAGVGEGIELGLKSISYVEKQLARSIDEIRGDLQDIGIPEKYLDDIVSEGYEGIKKLLIKLYYRNKNEEKES